MTAPKEADVRSGGASWLAIVDRALDVRSDGMVRMWTLELMRDGLYARVMTPEEAEELARALQARASAAREVRAAKKPSNG